MPRAASMSVDHLHRIPRQHGLDALRAFAMLLGIALHGSLSFAVIPWIVQDSRPDGFFGLLFLFIHGFRMQLFMLLSGYFTMMLWRRRGMGALLKQRAVRVFVPCLIGVFTVVPLFNWASMKAMEKARLQDARRPNVQNASGRSELIEAIRRNDLAVTSRLLEGGADPNKQDPEFGTPPLHWAARYGDPKMLKLLLDHGAEIKARDRDGYTALHSAAFLGHFRAVEFLVQHGADPQALGRQNETAMDSTRANWEATAGIAKLIRVPLLSEEELQAGREECRKFLAPLTKVKRNPNINREKGRLEKELESARKSYAGYLSSERFLVRWKNDAEPFHLVLTPVFHHLWFLWFLCWLVVGFVGCVVVGQYFQNVFRGWTISPRWVVSPLRWLWILPLTMVPQLFMGTFQAVVGPDTSSGLIPQPHVFLYYGIFFGFGALYYDCDDRDGKLGQYWWLALAVSVFIAFPLGLATMGNVVVSGMFQVIYAWGMAFGCIGLFNRLLTRENKTIRYLSDSAYWLYLVHLPLIVWLQALVRNWDLPAWPKFLMICTLCTGLLLVSYQFLVRYTLIGWLLNGPRIRAQATGRIRETP